MSVRCVTSSRPARTAWRRCSVLGPLLFVLLMCCRGDSPDLTSCISNPPTPALRPSAHVSPALTSSDLPARTEITPIQPSLRSSPAPSATSDVPAVASTARRPDDRYASQGTFVDRIPSGDRIRKFRVHIPRTYSPQEHVALVVAFHAAMSEARDLELQSRLPVRADEEGFVVVFPQSLPASPSAAEGPGRWDTRLAADNPDILFVRDLLAYLQGQLSIDPALIYATGFSNGATFADLLACTMSERLAAVASMSGGNAGPQAACLPKRAVPVLFFHGTADGGIPFRASGWSPSWVQRYHCDPESLVIVDQPGFRQSDWRICDDGAEVSVYTVWGGRHTWFSEPVDATEVLWSFFESHRLP